MTRIRHPPDKPAGKFEDIYQLLQIQLAQQLSLESRTRGSNLPGLPAGSLLEIVIEARLVKNPLYHPTKITRSFVCTPTHTVEGIKIPKSSILGNTRTNLKPFTVGQYYH